MLKWSEPTPPKNGKPSYYDHVVAETPLGRLMIEWKSWKEWPVFDCMLPDDKQVLADDLDEAKNLVQKAWDELAAQVTALATPDPDYRHVCPHCREQLCEVTHLHSASMCPGVEWHDCDQA